jgi:hypothetical protein
MLILATQEIQCVGKSDGISPVKNVCKIYVCLSVI